MTTDNKLKQDLIEKLSDFYDSIPIYSIKKLSPDEINEKAKYCASRFMGGDSLATFRSIDKRDDSILINLPWDTKMWVYNNSNAITIKRKINPLDCLIKGNVDVNRLGMIVIETMKRLKLDKWKLTFEQLEFESLGQIKAMGINFEETKSQMILCRIIGTFRRYINEIPVYGRASISIKIAGGNVIESIGLDWRHIQEKPIDNAKIIRPEIAAEKILKKFNSFLPNKILTSEDYSPVSFILGYLSMPKRLQQNYMQPVYIAVFKPLDTTSLRHVIVIPATNNYYESIKIE